MEKILEKSYALSKNENMRKRYSTLAFKREGACRKYFKSNALGFFSDYNFIENKTTDVAAASSLYILTTLQEPNPEGIYSWGASAKRFIEKYLLKDGGLVSTTNLNGQQWDAPNGWAPQQWMAIEGLERCNQKELAKDIALRWIKLNNDVYLRTGKLMEKYNVVDTHLEAGGGEYAGQDGFGWTNGVLLALIKKYGK
jgi:alpha,alpha-trehalase